jgi:hypothetical protein
MPKIWLRRDAVGENSKTSRLDVDKIDWSFASSGYIEASNKRDEYAVPLTSILYVTED